MVLPTVGEGEFMSEVNKLIDRLEEYFDVKHAELYEESSRTPTFSALAAAYTNGKVNGGASVIKEVEEIVDDFRREFDPKTTSEDYILHLNLGTKVTPLSIADALVDWIFHYFKSADELVEGQSSEFLRVVGEALLSEYKRIERIRELNK